MSSDPSLEEKAEGVAYVFLERFEKFRLPRALEIRDRVEQGAKLDSFDMEFLTRVLDDAQAIKQMVDQRPDLQDLYARAVELYHEITEKALANEENTD